MYVDYATLQFLYKPSVGINDHCMSRTPLYCDPVRNVSQLTTCPFFGRHTIDFISVVSILKCREALQATDAFNRKQQPQRHFRRVKL